MKRVLRSRVDLEALEVTLRLSGAEHILTRKTKILVTLTESFPEYDAVFVNRSRRALRAVPELLLGVLRTVYKVAKGWILLRVHGLL